MRFEANQFLSRVSATEGCLSPELFCTQQSYGEHRSELLEVVGRWKSERRVAVGSAFTLLFENRFTVWLQIQEELHMGGASRAVELDRLLTQYNPLIPEPGELRASLFLDCRDKEKMLRYLSDYSLSRLGLELAIGGGVLSAEPLFEAEEYLDAVTFIRFRPTNSVAFAPNAQLRWGGTCGSGIELGSRTERSLLVDLQTERVSKLNEHAKRGFGSVHSARSSHAG